MQDKDTVIVNKLINYSDDILQGKFSAENFLTHTTVKVFLLFPAIAV